MNFEGFFKKATEYEPYPFQQLLAKDEKFPSVIEAPTGTGKTAAVILSWLWRRRLHVDANVRQSTPRRLIYCLPMRVLVEQTRNNAILWLQREGLLGGEASFTLLNGSLDLNFYKPSWKEEDKIPVITLMGGEDDYNWDIYPERDAIIIGTQDMLLSRALNRGYGMSRYKWPIHFGLLNNDSLWIMDEIQLMGNGLITSVQLDAFRRHFGTVKDTQTVWMSATINHDLLKSVDFELGTKEATELKLSEEDKKIEGIRKVLNCKKILKKVEMIGYDYDVLSSKVLREHTPGSRTLVILNTVGRAVELYHTLSKKKPDAELLLIHSHFRAQEREAVLQRLFQQPGAGGMIVVSTQVIEAGVDISSETMFTEIAPISSMIQRFGRCNRYGEFKTGKIFWIDLLNHEKSNSNYPYSMDDLVSSRKFLQEVNDQSLLLENFPQVSSTMNDLDVIRPKDFVELFNTTTDLTGQDLDISRFIRNDHNRNVQVFWRDFTNNASLQEPFPLSEELCSVPVSDMKTLIRKRKDAWMWDSLNGEWVKLISVEGVTPGRIILLNASDGHYSITEGWGLNHREKVSVLDQGKSKVGDWYNADTSAINEWKTIAQHTDEVVEVAEKISARIGLTKTFSKDIRDAARWHDSGKAHPAFQAKLKLDKMPAGRFGLMAKAPADCWKGNKLPVNVENGETRRKNFRHELVSGLLALTNGQSDIAAYLATAHHGKVRVLIRSMPDEYVPDDENKKYACGVWDGDEVPEVDLGNYTIVRRTKLDLSLMEIGDGLNGSSWLSRVLKLCDHPELGIIRLGYLESLVRAADRRASGGK